jgi:hypothetical protein
MGRRSNVEQGMMNVEVKSGIGDQGLGDGGGRRKGRGEKWD